MAYALPYTALVTPADVYDERVETQELDLSNDAVLTVVGRLIEASTAVIEQWVGRRVVVHAFEQAPRWMWRADFERYETWADEWPVVEAEGSDAEPITTGPARPGGQTLRSGSMARTIAGFAGYRRQDQDLPALAAESDLSGLTTLPGTIPADIHDACIELVLLRLQRRRHGLGRISQTVDLGGATVQSDRVQGSFQIDTDPERQILSRLLPYRR